MIINKRKTAHLPIRHPLQLLNDNWQICWPQFRVSTSSVCSYRSVVLDFSPQSGEEHVAIGTQSTWRWHRANTEKILADHKKFPIQSTQVERTDRKHTFPTGRKSWHNNPATNPIRECVIYEWDTFDRKPRHDTVKVNSVFFVITINRDFLFHQAIDDDLWRASVKFNE